MYRASVPLPTRAEVTFKPGAPVFILSEWPQEAGLPLLARIPNTLGTVNKREVSTRQHIPICEWEAAQMNQSGSEISLFLTF